MARPKKGRARVVFIAAMNAPGSEIRRMIAAGYPLTEVFARHSETLAGCSYAMFVRHAHKLLNVPKGTRKPKKTEDQATHDGSSAEPATRARHQQRGAVEGWDPSCEPADIAGKLGRHKPKDS